MEKIEWRRRNCGFPVLGLVEKRRSLKEEEKEKASKVLYCILDVRGL